METLIRTLGSVATPNNTGLSRHKVISEAVGGWGNKAKWQYANDQVSKLCQQVNHTRAIYIEIKHESPPNPPQLSYSLMKVVCAHKVA